MLQPVCDWANRKVPTGKLLGGLPYRYNEKTWADDMEWAAAELYKALGKADNLTDAKRYAAIIGATSWMQYESSDMGEQMSRHYERYPFTNIGHYELYGIADGRTKREVATYYRDGIERIFARGKTNPYGVGVPFLWCSNNLVVAYVTQVMLYERMTGDLRYHKSMLGHWDWLLGRNPWGTSMFTMIPRTGEYPGTSICRSFNCSKSRYQVVLSTVRSIRKLIRD